MYKNIYDLSSTYNELMSIKVVIKRKKRNSEIAAARIDRRIIHASSSPKKKNM